MPHAQQADTDLSSMYSPRELIEKIHAKVQMAECSLVKCWSLIIPAVFVFELLKTGEFPSIKVYGIEFHYRPAIIAFPVVFSALFCFSCRCAAFIAMGRRMMYKVLSAVDPAMIRSGLFVCANGSSDTGLTIIFDGVGDVPGSSRLGMRWIQALHVLALLYYLMTMIVIAVGVFDAHITEYNRFWPVYYMSFTQRGLFWLFSVVGLALMSHACHRSAGSLRTP